MPTSYTTITQRFTGEFDPATSSGGEAFLLDLTLGPIWNSLLSKDHDGFGPVRVVSAWNAFRDGCDEDDGYDEWHNVVKGRVESDLGKVVAATRCWDCDVLYRAFALSYQALGSDWPTKVLAIRMQRMDGASADEADALAQVVWDRALTLYKAHKAAVKAAEATRPVA